MKGVSRFIFKCPSLQHMERPTQEGLIRGIRRWDLVALTVNILVGAGIFGLPSKIYELTGAWSTVAFVVCAVLSTLIVLCFAEVGSRFSETGGPYLYTRVAFGSVVGFEVAWLLWVARLTGFAALCNLLTGYLSFFWPAAGLGLARALIITAVVIVLTGVNFVGVRESALITNLFTIGKITPLLLFISAGFFFLNREAFTIEAPPGWHNFSRAALLLIFAFSGFEMSVIPSGEIRDPQRNIAFALLTATGAVTVLYLMIQIVCIGTLPGLAVSERPLVDSSSRFLGASGASIILVGAVISVTGTLNTIMLSAPRLLFAMAEHGQLPHRLASTHRRFHTPHISILISAVLMLVFTLQGTFMSALTISTVTRLIAYLATCISLPVLRYRNDVPVARFNVPGGVAVAVVASALTVWLLSNSTLTDASEAALAAVLGVIIYFCWGRARKIGALT